MKKFIRFTKFFSVILIPIVVSSFAWLRHSAREFHQDDFVVHYHQDNDIFITKNDIMEKVFKDNLPKKLNNVNLNEIESSLQNDPFIEQVQVYLLLNGKLIIDVRQKEPIARIMGNDSFYMDRLGEKMPLSKHFSKPVPFIHSNTNITPENKELWNNFYRIAKFVYNNSDLKKIIGSMNFENNQFILKTKSDFKIVLGDISQAEHKLKKFIVFMKQEGNLEKYNGVNLDFKDQVIAIKSK